MGSVPDGVAITPDGTRAYVTNSFSDTVSVIDTATLFPVATITVVGGAQSVAITPNGTRAYVVNGEGDTVAVIDTATNAVVLYIGVDDLPLHVAVTPDGSRAYVTNYVSNTVSVIDTSSNTVVATVAGGGEPRGVAIGPASAPPPTTTTTTVPRSVTGRAFGYSWFLTTNGGAAPTAGPIPTVVLPEGGSDTPITAAAPTGEALFSVGAPFFTSGPITVSTQGTPAGGTVTSAAEILDVNTTDLARLAANSLTSTCEATEAGVTRSATVTNGTVVTDTGDDDPGNFVPDHPPVVVDVPADPGPNTEITGHSHGPATGQEDFRYVFNE
ncbi:MAG: YncE family protein, partial [Actinobacteria bacterium]|nr:YncE family protein [Actinomycetota bacterium]